MGNDVADGQYDPAGHKVHDSEPATAAYVPPVHAAQVADDVALTVEEAEPAGHGVRG